jgi:hypothetical protein
MCDRLPQRIGWSDRCYNKCAVDLRLSQRESYSTNNSADSQPQTLKHAVPRGPTLNLNTILKCQPLSHYLVPHVYRTYLSRTTQVTQPKKGCHQSPCLARMREVLQDTCPLLSESYQLSHNRAETAHLLHVTTPTNPFTHVHMHEEQGTSTSIAACLTTAAACGANPPSRTCMHNRQ